MALDQQRNWDISMAENLQQIQSKTKQLSLREEEVLPVQAATLVVRPFDGPPIYLPDEIIIEILDYVSHFAEAQKTLAACCLLCHQWYTAAVPYLYERPQLYGKNFDPFAHTICPSINLHVRKSVLSELVKELDLGRLVHQASKSMTARLLGRTKANLERFRAPQASFAINCLPALARCSKLKDLDLSLVSESPPLPALLKAVSTLNKLQSFRLPRSAGFGSYDGREPFLWPPHLQRLALSGGIDAWFLAGIVRFPETLRSLIIEHCPQAKSRLVVDFMVNSLRKLPLLEDVRISNMPRFGAHAMDDLLHILPNVRRLSISVDYISAAVFHEGSLRKFILDDALRREDVLTTPSLRHERLHTLELTNSGNPSVEDKVTPIDVLIAIDEDVVPALRVVRVAKSLYWHSGENGRDAEALSDALQARNKHDWEARVGEFEHMPTEQWRTADPARTAGVWTFDG